MKVLPRFLIETAKGLMTSVHGTGVISLSFIRRFNFDYEMSPIFLSHQERNKSEEHGGRWYRMKKKKTGISAEKQKQWILQGKYVILAVLVGICVGIVDTIFGRGLLAISDFRGQYYRYLLPILPVAGLAIVWMYQRFSSLSLKGMTLVFEVGQKKREEIPLALVPLVMIGTWITHLFGGSAGREGVAVQIGATLSHETGRRLHIKETKPVMLITGMAAGFGGLFQTPLAAVFFAMGGRFRLCGI